MAHPQTGETTLAAAGLVWVPTPRLHPRCVRACSLPIRGLLMLTPGGSRSLSQLIRPSSDPHQMVRISLLGFLPLSAPAWPSPAGIPKSPSTRFLCLHFTLKGRTTPRTAWSGVGTAVLLHAHVCLVSPQQRRAPMPRHRSPIHPAPASLCSPRCQQSRPVSGQKSICFVAEGRRGLTLWLSRGGSRPEACPPVFVLTLLKG